MTQEEQLDRLYSNLASDYKFDFKRSEFSSVGEMLKLGEEFEDKVEESRRKRNRNDTHHCNWKTTANSNPQKNFAVSAQIGNSSYSSENFMNGDKVVEVPVTSKRNACDPISRKIDQDKETRLSRINNPFIKHGVPQRIEATRSREQRKTYICYNCDEPGHISRYCKRPYNPHCHLCQRKGVTTNRCNCRNEPPPTGICAKSRQPGHTMDSCRGNVLPSTLNARSMKTQHLGILDSRIDLRPNREVVIENPKSSHEYFR
uniref:CCHC-type domain-containing protein n=1 Tax=Megaselia scalaris TaxID=36166 RepID=T1H270_MEGSC